MQQSTKHRTPIRLRFGLRTFLVGVTLTAAMIALATTMFRPWYEDKDKIAFLKTVNSQVFTEPRDQFLLRQIFGDRFSERPVYLHLDDPRVDDDWLKQLGPMKHIEVLSIKSPNLSDSGLKELTNWPNLKSLNLVDTAVSESAIASLRQTHPSLLLIESRQSEQ